MKALGLGLVGCGQIAPSYLDNAARFSGVEIVAVADCDMSAANARAETYSLRPESVGGLFAADDIDIVVNLTPPDAHYAISKGALEQGKSVYSENPFALSIEEGAELVRASKVKGLRLGSSPDRFLGASHQHARALIDAGEIGDVVSGVCHVPLASKPQPGSDIFTALIDFGSYAVSNLVQLLGPVARVHALSSAQGQADYQTTLHASLEFCAGAIVTITASLTAPCGTSTAIDLRGTRGGISLPDATEMAGPVVVMDADGPKRTPPMPCHPLTPRSLADEEMFRMVGCVEMAQAVLQGRPHRCSADFGLHITDILASVALSGQMDRPVVIKTTCERPGPLDAEQARTLFV